MTVLIGPLALDTPIAGFNSGATVKPDGSVLEEEMLSPDVERLNGDSGLGAIFPPLATTVMMFDALGWPADISMSRPRLTLEKFVTVDATRCRLTHSAAISEA